MDVATATAPLPRNLAIAQIVAVLITIEGALWTHGRTQGVWFITAVGTLALCVLISRPRIGELGIGLRGMVGASTSIPIALAAAAVILGVAYYVGTLRTLYGTTPVHWHSIFYAIWALEQQFILNSFFYRRFESLMGDTMGAMVVTALLFSFVHLPNPVLVPATFVGGMFFIAVFRRWRNIYPLAIAHAVLGLSLAMAFPDSWIRHMRVGLSFLRFRV